MTSAYNQAQWEKNVQKAYKLLTEPMISTNKDGQVQIAYRTWKDVKKITGLSWATLQEVSQIIEKTMEKLNENLRPGIERTDSGDDQDPLPGNPGPGGELDADIHQG